MQKDSEPSLVRLRLSRRKFALQIRHGSALPRARFFKTFCPCQKKRERDCVPFSIGRGRRTRTHDPWFWRPVLYQLSYTPVCSFLQRSILYHRFEQIASPFAKKDKVFSKKEIRLSLSRISFLRVAFVLRKSHHQASNTRRIFTLLGPWNFLDSFLVALN